MADKSNYFSLSSLSLARTSKCPRHIGSRAKSLSPPRQEASSHAAKLKTAMAHDALEEERFAFTTEDSTQAGRRVLFNTLNRKQLSSQDRRLRRESAQRSTSLHSKVFCCFQIGKGSQRQHLRKNFK